MIKNRLKYRLTLAMIIMIGTAFGQTDPDPDEEVFHIESVAERKISPSYRITEKPEIIDTIIPIPNISYPLLSRNMRTEISIEQIGASKIRIVEKLDKLYPGYVRLGIGNYGSPLGEFYFNSVRNRRSRYGVHLNHNSSFGNINGYAPSSFDNTTGKVFGEFFTSRFKFEGEVDYLNNGYHFYGIEDSAEVILGDTIRNRVQAIGGGFKMSNFTRKDSATLLYTAKTDFTYFHEFDPNDLNMNARNSNFGIGGDFAYKLKRNVYALDFNVRYNKYRFALDNPNVNIGDWHDNNNTIIQLKPVISSYGDQWKVIYGVDMNFDIQSDPVTGDNVFKVIPIIEGKYSLFNDMFIPYAGIGGGVKQNTFQTLNRTNEFIVSEIHPQNTREFKVYGGIKGTLSKNLSFNIQAHSTSLDNLPLFVNDSIWSDFNRFDVVFDQVNALGVNGSISYQAAEKLKVDAIVAYNSYTAQNEMHAWNLPEIDITLRGSYNLYDKIYVKSDVTLLGGRRSPEGLFLTNPTDEDFNLGFVADANLHAEYRYNNRVSAFIQFNNLAGQKYFRWNRYRVQGFQVLGGVTFGF